jgi:hypothetical protein
MGLILYGSPNRAKEFFVVRHTFSRQSVCLELSGNVYVSVDVQTRDVGVVVVAE